jgi:dihydrofolate reductase
MPKLRVHAMSVSVDGYAAGLDQSLDNPLGVGAEQLHEWIFETRFWREQIGEGGGSTGLDDSLLATSFEGIGAWIMGRNMFGPVRGEWPDESWRGWWGETPPYHCPVFVLTHHPRAPLAMDGGTTFHFVSDPIDVVLARAFEAAGGADVRLGGGASTVQQFLRCGLIDELHLAIAPVLLGAGERLFDHLDGGPSGYESVTITGETGVAHVRMARSAR